MRKCKKDRKKHTDPNCQCASCKSKRGEYDGKNNPFYGKKHTKESKRKISENHADVSKEKNPSWKKERVIDKKYYCKDCNKKISYNSAICGQGRCYSCASKIRMKSIDISGKKNPMYGTLMKPHWGTYKNIKMRSSYEIAYAKYLDKNNIEWNYEPKTFDLENSTYTPDFYLLGINKYIEIKGYLSEKAKLKIEKFKKTYPNIEIDLLMQKDLQELGVL